LENHTVKAASQMTTRWSDFSCNPFDISSKEPYISSKEPYISSKELYISSKKPYIFSKEHGGGEREIAQSTRFLKEPYFSS